MHRQLLNFAAFLSAAALLTSCGKEEKPSRPQIIYAGLGISNRVQLGMTLKELRKNNRDLEVNRVWKPDTRPWEKIWNKPQYIEVKIPSSCVYLGGVNEKGPFGEMLFDCAQLRPTLLRAGTNEIWLSSNQLISIDDVVGRFGQPRFEPNSYSPLQLPAIINAGQSVILTNGLWRTYYYPAQGVFFHFNQKEVVSFSITRKFRDTNTAATVR